VKIAFFFYSKKTNQTMDITGKIHCFFEQSGTFKNEFKKLGFYAEDYDIQNEFGETDNVIDLFAEIGGFPLALQRIGGICVFLKRMR